MVDAVTKPQPFTTIKYTTKDGENISATKNNGVVTLVGDKNGVRQMPLEDFKKELVENLPQVALEKTPEKDIVEIAKKDETITKPGENKASIPVEEKNSNTTEVKSETGKKIDVAA